MFKNMKKKKANLDQCRTGGSTEREKIGIKSSRVAKKELDEERFSYNPSLDIESKLCLIRDDVQQQKPQQVQSKWCSVEDEGPFARNTPFKLEFTNPLIKQVYLRSEGMKKKDFSLKNFRYSINEIKDNIVEIETKVKRDHIKPCLDIIKEAKSLTRDAIVHSVELATTTRINEVIIKVS